VSACVAISSPSLNITAPANPAQCSQISQTAAPGATSVQDQACTVFNPSLNGGQAYSQCYIPSDYVVCICIYLYIHLCDIFSISIQWHSWNSAAAHCFTHVHYIRH
jgi:hypothetical protein